MNYLKEYTNLCSTRFVFKHDRLGSSDYFERHHIIPKCVGGSDEESNIVLLTDREHFIAHALLAFYARRHQSGTIKRDLIFSHYMMKSVGKTKRGYVNENLYKNWHDSFDNEARLKVSETSKRMWDSPQFKEKMKRIMAITRQDESYKQKHRDGLRKAFRTKEMREKLSSTSKLMWDDPIIAKRIVTGIRSRFLKNPNANCPYVYTITNPDGETETVRNLATYCKANNMTGLDFRNGKNQQLNRITPRKGKWKGYTIIREQIKKE